MLALDDFYNTGECPEMVTTIRDNPWPKQKPPRKTQNQVCVTPRINIRLRASLSGVKRKIGLVLALIGGALIVPSAGSATPYSAATFVTVGHNVASGMSKTQQEMALVAFNGYYALDNAPGAYFFVDTNVYVTDGGSKRRYVVSLIVSLDGMTSRSVNFSGRFDGKHLTQRSAGEPSFDLVFDRAPNRLGPTVNLSGTISLPGQAPTATSGATYDNPIPFSFWGGQTYYAPATAPGGKPTVAVVMGKNGELFYDKGSSGKSLMKIKSYRYNLDMYYFKFTGGYLIMGTAGESGLTINDMGEKDGKVVSQRALVTHPRANTPSAGVENWYPKPTDGPALIDFSGYYSIATKKYPNAFISIEGEDLVDPELSPVSLSRVLISVSLNKKTVKSWYYDTASQMTFNGAVLTMPKQRITLRFQREDNPRTGGLFHMMGKIKDRKVQGSSPFNAVPLSVFAGSMSDTAGQHMLVITKNGDVSLDGQVIPNYQYVPTMYILAGPLPGSTVVPQEVTLLSLGYTGTNGTTAIVTTDYGTPQAKTFTVYAIP